MKECTFLESYTDWSGGGLSDSAVIEHLRSCPDCRETLAAWREIAPEIAAADRAVLGNINEQPDSIAVQRMVLRARAEQNRPTSSFVTRWTVVTAAAVACAIAVLIGLEEDGPTPQPNANEPIAVFGSASVMTVEGRVSQTLDAAHPELIVPKEGRARARIGGDVLGLSGGAEVRIEKAQGAETVVSLGRGTVSVAAAHRDPGESLVVRAGPVRVRVVGTRFSVTRGDGGVTETAVSEGRVEVSDGAGGLFLLDAGQRLRTAPDAEGAVESLRETDRKLMDLLLSEVREVPESVPQNSASDESKPASTESVATDAILPDAGMLPQSESEESRPGRLGARGSRKTNSELSEWRRWVLSGRTTDAEAALRSHVDAHPKDAAAWSLLADCCRKRGNWTGAVEALGRAASFGKAREAGRARFRAGVILQDRLQDHEAAAKQFRAYLRSGGGTLKAEASVRLAISLLSLGRQSEARALLERTAAEHGGTTAAADAQKMLLEL